MPPSRLDSFYRRLLITKFFEKGWGKPENLQRLFEFRKIVSNRELCYKLVDQNYPVNITKQEKSSDCTILEGKFTTPLETYLPGLVPKAARQAHFQILLPNEWKDQRHKPMCIHLAGTGDHYYWRRRNFIAKPLLREAGLGSILLENPFYGVRKPEDQTRSNLRNVSDIFVMGGCLILECLVLLHWCERNGFGPLGITGLSMGGHMASLAATNWPKPLVLVPCLSWSTASTVFTTGVMSQSINWDMLETQYFADGQYRERLSKMVTVCDDAFMAGQHFIKNFNLSMKALKTDIIDVTQFDDDNLISETIHNTAVNPKGNTIETPLIHSQVAKTNVQEILLPKEEQLSNLTKLMRMILPKNSKISQAPDKIDITKTKWWENEALQFMKGMMDECTHLKNFSVPYDTSLIIAVCAKADAYVPREGCSSLEDIWPGVEVRYLDAGHVSAYVLYQKLFRSSIVEAFERAKKQVDKQANYVIENTCANVLNECSQNEQLRSTA